MEDGPTSDVARAGLVVAGKFRLDAMIGQGGMGSVWSATHLGLGNRIAIKLVSREFVRSPDALRRFDAEAKAAARLQSRHVVQVYDSGTLDDATPYIAMELLSGQNLQGRIEASGPVSLAESVDILAQCCKGLGRAHALGIVHRDIKPDNIFLAQSPDDEGYTVKILDFGVAKLSQASDRDGSTTKTGTVLGTPLYMSPEQARGLRGIDHRTDIYSLGLVAYTMLTGRVAFNGESFGDILLKICTEPLPKLSASVNVPPSLESWFGHVCARDPAARCASTQEFIETLRAAVGDAIPRARAPSSPGVGSGPNFTPALLDSGVAPPGPRSAAAQSVSAANVSITASGLPRSHAGMAVAVAAGVTLLGAGGIGFALFAAHHREPQAASASVAAPESRSATPPAAIAPAETLAPAMPPPSTLGPPEAAAVPPPSPGSHGGAQGALGAVASGGKPPSRGAPSHGPAAQGPATPPAKTAASPSPSKIDLGY
jgi:eukaryotic-like serine/threonine-protein kinase